MSVIACNAGALIGAIYILANHHAVMRDSTAGGKHNTVFSK